MYQFVQSHAKEIQDELNEFPSYEVKVWTSPPPTHAPAHFSAHWYALTIVGQESLERLKYLTQEVDSLDSDEEEEGEEEGTSSSSDQDELDVPAISPRP
jgi:hypothetical protein